jgi:hypothetical protein
MSTGAICLRMRQIRGELFKVQLGEFGSEYAAGGKRCRRIDGNVTGGNGRYIGPGAHAIRRQHTLDFGTAIGLIQ